MSNRRRWFSGRKKWEQDMQDELRFHIERQTASSYRACSRAWRCSWRRSESTA
jgi:hypothetical protein